MSEPTREQIKEAFKKTIERWEKIVEDVDYFADSNCNLCQLPSQGCTSCPIFQLNVHNHNCEGTPFWDFNAVRTHENALAELNFLRKVYIWWIEKEEGVKLVDYLRKEKKEEWEDYTHHISWETKDYKDVELPYLLYGTNYKGEEIVYVNESGKHICHNYKEKYRLEQRGETFRILKKT